MISLGAKCVISASVKGPSGHRGTFVESAAALRGMALVTMAVLAYAASSCGDKTSNSSFVSDERIVYSDGLHNENTEMIRLADRILLVFRGGETGQIGSSRARIKIFASTDEGQTFRLQSEVNANNLPDGRDIRDPKLVEMNGKLFLYAISRVPGPHYRDVGGQAWTIRAESSDGGETWSLPVKTFADVDSAGKETYWGFWRFTERSYTVDGKPRQTLFATAYTDLDIAVGVFASEDGVTWQKRATIIDSYDDVPSEAELQFFGANQESAVALVRLDNQDILADGQTAICTSSEPFVDWECGRRLEQRLDGPTWIVRQEEGRARSFVFARKHLPCTFKRTAAYELRGELTDPDAAIEVCEIRELPSSGDTAYTALAPLSSDRYLLSWYSSPVERDIPWFEGIYAPSDIWLAQVDFGAAPGTCTPPPAKRSCAPDPLPSDAARFDVTGDYLLTLAPEFWPSETVLFRATAHVDGAGLTLRLQPLDHDTQSPVGEPWIAAPVPIEPDGHFRASFATQSVPLQAYPRLGDPVLTVREFVLDGVTTSASAFCGNVLGYAQVFGERVSDRVRLEGSTFGATPLREGVTVMPLAACAGTTSADGP